MRRCCYFKVETIKQHTGLWGLGRSNSNHLVLSSEASSGSKNFTARESWGKSWWLRQWLQKLGELHTYNLRIYVYINIYIHINMHINIQIYIYIQINIYDINYHSIQPCGSTSGSFHPHLKKRNLECGSFTITSQSLLKTSILYRKKFYSSPCQPTIPYVIRCH